MKLFPIKQNLLTISVAFFLITSCEKAKEIENFSTKDVDTITEESETEYYFQDLDDLSKSMVEASVQEDPGRADIDDQRICSNSVVTINSTGTAQNPAGTIVIDFKDGCSDLRGNVRKGKIIITYNGRLSIEGGSVIVTTDNYTINGVKLEGTRTTTNIEASENLHFKTVLNGGKATFSNGSTATREATIYWYWERAQLPVNDKFIVEITSTASGKTRNGTTYVVTLTQPLEFKRFCGIATKGIKVINIDNNRTVTIDYGDGTCDRKVVVAIGGVTRTVTI